MDQNDPELFIRLTLENMSFTWELKEAQIDWQCPVYRSYFPGFTISKLNDRNLLQSYYISEGLFVPQKDLDSAKKVHQPIFRTITLKWCTTAQIKLVVVKMESESNCDTRDLMVRVQEQIAEVWLNKQISL